MTDIKSNNEANSLGNFMGSLQNLNDPNNNISSNTPMTKYIASRNFVIACRYGLVKEVTQNINEIDDINMKFEYGRTFLLYAVIGDHLDVFKILLNHPNINSYCTSQNGYNVLHYAIIHNSTNISSWLIKTDGLYYKKLLLGKTFRLRNSVHVAIGHKNIQFILKLVREEKNRYMLLEKDTKSMTPFMYAIKKSYFALADILYKCTSEIISIDAIHYPLFKGIYAQFWLVRGDSNGRDAVYLTLKTESTQTEFSLNLDDSVIHLEEDGIILTSNFGTNLSKKGVNKLYTKYGITKDLYHYDLINHNELITREIRTIKRFLEKVKEKYSRFQFSSFQRCRQKDPTN